MRSKVVKTYLNKEQVEMLEKLIEKNEMNTSEYLKSLIIREYYKTEVQ